MWKIGYPAVLPSIALGLVVGKPDQLRIEDVQLETAGSGSRFLVCIICSPCTVMVFPLATSSDGTV